jgi:hypothetical protein
MTIKIEINNSNSFGHIIYGQDLKIKFHVGTINLLTFFCNIEFKN